jgi:hypothetical protein
MNDRPDGSSTGGEAATTAGASRGPADPMTTISASSAPPLPIPPATRRPEGGIEPGDLLNGIYRVDRFLARGGMGDVYEGVNVETDDRVAIKAIRRHLASDPKMAALFRKEAKVLTQLSHPAIVDYRVLAREPQLDLLYIVTDFVDGEALSAHLDGTRPSLSRVLRLARRLAGGLHAAHLAGVIHRDISPDNILLPGGALERARIIDFGIAKSLDVGAETVVGTGFAGKLGYVAPEQFGDHGRQIGPWTDVYSTALVLLAFARGRPSDMGATLVDAVERRRSVPPLDEVPSELVPVLTRMLVPDPAERLRSMDAVLDALDGIDGVLTTAATATAGSWKPAVTTFTAAAPSAPARPTIDKPSAGDRRRRPLGAGVIATGVAGLLALVGGVALYQRPSRSLAPSAAVRGRPATRAAIAPTLSPLQTALISVPCSWISTSDLRPGPPLVLAGASGDVAGIVTRTQAALTAAGLHVAQIDASAVVSMPPSGCAVAAASRLSDVSLHGTPATLHATNAVLALSSNSPGCPAGLRARPQIAWGEGGRREFAVLGLLPSGQIVQITGSRGEFTRQSHAHPDYFQDSGDGTFRLGLCLTETGPMGFLLVQADRPITLGLTTGRPITPSENFYDLFRRQTARHGWVTQAAWFRIDPAQAQPPATIAKVATATVAARRSLRSKPTLKPVTVSGSSTVPSVSAPNVALCRRFSGQKWKELGQLSPQACIEQVYARDCSVTYGLHGMSRLRRLNGSIDIENAGRWVRVQPAPICRGGLSRLLHGLVGEHDQSLSQPRPKN